MNYKILRILTLLSISLFAHTSFSSTTCHDAVKTSSSQHTQDSYQLNSEWFQLEEKLTQARDLKELSKIQIGEFEIVQSNIIRQFKFLDATIQLAKEKNFKVEKLKILLKLLNEIQKTHLVNYHEYWLIHFAMQIVTDFNFQLKVDASTAKLDISSIDYLLDLLKRPDLDLSQIKKLDVIEYSIQRSMGLMHFYTDFNNPRFSVEKNRQVKGDERIPLPFFQRGFDIVEINNLAKMGHLRPVEIISGYYKVKNGQKVFQAPMVDARLMGVGKDASDHDFNHLGFEVSAKATANLGRLMFEGSEVLSYEAQMVLHTIYFKAWHELGINLATMESGTQWPLLLRTNHLRMDMSNINYFGSDPKLFKSTSGIEEAVQFLEKKKLPDFWKE